MISFTDSLHPVTLLLFITQYILIHRIDIFKSPYKFHFYAFSNKLTDLDKIVIDPGNFIYSNQQYSAFKLIDLSVCGPWESNPWP